MTMRWPAAALILTRHDEAALPQHSISDDRSNTHNDVPIARPMAAFAVPI